MPPSESTAQLSHTIDSFAQATDADLSIGQQALQAQLREVLASSAKSVQLLVGSSFVAALVRVWPLGSLIVAPACPLRCLTGQALRGSRVRQFAIAYSASALIHVSIRSSASFCMRPSAPACLYSGLASYFCVRVHLSCACCLCVCLCSRCLVCSALRLPAISCSLHGHWQSVPCARSLAPVVHHGRAPQSCVALRSSLRALGAGWEEW